MDILTILKVVFKIIPWLLSVTTLHQFLYYKYPKYYFFIAKRFKKWRDTKWKITVSYRVDKDSDFFRALEKSIDNNFKKKSKVFNLKNKKQYEFSDFILTVQYDLDVSNTEEVIVELLFGNITATLSNSKEKLTRLRRLFTSIEREIRITHKSYNMKIFFTSIKNPFYGLMIQRLGEEHVDYFECQFPITSLTKKEFKEREEFDLNLTVYKDYISINNDTFDIIEEIAKKCLILE
ncbi:hypothetical protein [Heyndrickxia coagulans]|uniref:hypothetical protein n=1 Tax=Heyndrickxia coagulans TaxID=1398 RepID=UPI001E3C26D3|nr:hypothetical protein [Heyndrickxia coagulans]